MVVKSRWHEFPSLLAVTTFPQWIWGYNDKEGNLFMRRDKYLRDGCVVVDRLLLKDSSSCLVIYRPEEELVNFLSSENIAKSNP